VLTEKLNSHFLSLPDSSNDKKRIKVIKLKKDLQILKNNSLTKNI